MPQPFKKVREFAGTLSAIGVIAIATLYFVNTYATQEQVEVVENKSNYLLDVYIERNIKEIGRIEDRIKAKKASETEKIRLQDLKEDTKNMRKARRGQS